MDGGRVEVDLRTCADSNHAALFGEFSAAAGSRQVRYAVSLTERDLTVRRIGSSSSAPVGRSRLVLSLRDCVGSRADRAAPGAGEVGDPAALLSVFFYSLRRRRMGSGVSRHRVAQSFRVAPGQDPRANLAEAERWARAIRERSARQHHRRTGAVLSEVRRPCRMMLLVNPQSGKGQALSLYNSHIQRMLDEAGVPHTLVITERQNHARELVREADLSQWDALVIMSGDGLLFEVINGLLERSDWEEAIITPLGILPGGSGNALAASIHHYSGGTPVSSEELLVSCGFLLCKGLVSRMALVSVHLPSSPRLFSFLSLAWGFVADVDVESEKYRHVGAARFTVGTLVRLASLRVYHGKLAYLPAAQEEGCTGCDTKPHCKAHSPSRPCWPSKNSSCRNAVQYTFHNSCNSNNSLKGRRRESPAPRNVTNNPNGPVDSLLPPLDQPVPSDWVVVQEEDFVLLLAMYQSHLAEDLMAAPDAALDDGVIHLFYVRAGISRTALLRLFLAMEKGTHLATDCHYLVYVKVRALRLEPYSSKGVIMVDGEVVEYGPVQAQVHAGLARLISG